MLGKIFQEAPIFDGKNMVSGEDFPFNQSHETMERGTRRNPKGRAHSLAIGVPLRSLRRCEKTAQPSTGPGTPPNEASFFSQGFSHILGTIKGVLNLRGGILYWYFMVHNTHTPRKGDDYCGSTLQVSSWASMQLRRKKKERLGQRGVQPMELKPWRTLWLIVDAI